VEIQDLDLKGLKKRWAKEAGPMSKAIKLASELVAEMPEFLDMILRLDAENKRLTAIIRKAGLDDGRKDV
jgi:hypothetical protein